MRGRILSWLLHHANRRSKSEQFYAIKDRILSKYGKIVGHDVQHIEGKKCYSCDGTGVHAKYSNRPPYGIYDYADCYHCWGGWYKFPQWILLQRIEFNGYTFHKPIQRERKIKNPFLKSEGWQVNEKIVDGYIEHSYTNHGEFALRVLYLIYDPKYLLKYIWEDARAWRLAWWLPRNYLQNLLHIIRYRHNAIPFTRMMRMRKVRAWIQDRKNTPVYHTPAETEDLPF